MSDPASATVDRQLDALAELCARFAAEQLVKHGEFYPFAAWVRGQELRMVAAQTDEERPRADTVIAQLGQGLRRSAEQERFDACALAADVRVQHGDRMVEALRLDVESRDRAPVTVFLPYERIGEDVTYGPPLTEAGVPRAFPAD